MDPLEPASEISSQTQPVAESIRRCSTRSAAEGPITVSEDPERLPKSAGSIVNRFWQCFRRLPDPRRADPTAAPQEHNPVEIKALHTTSQLSPQKCQTQRPQEMETLLESMVRRLTDWFSQELAEQISTGVDAHFGARRHALLDADVISDII